MNDNHELLPAGDELSSHGEGAGALDPEGRSGPNPIRLAHRLLRGRYKWAILLATIFASTAAYFAYTAVPLKYESVALVQVKPYLPEILYKTGEKGIPGYDGFMQTQIARILSRRVLEMAKGSQIWRQTAGDQFDDKFEVVEKGLDIDYTKGTQFLRIAELHEDPRVAHASVKAIVEAFISVFDEEEVQKDTDIFEALFKRRQTLTADRTRLQDQLEALCAGTTEEAIRNKYHALSTELNGLEESERSLKMRIDRMRAAAAAMTPVNQQLSWQAIATQSLEFRALLDELDRKEQQVKLLSKEYGAKHRTMIQAVLERDEQEKKVQRYADFWQMQNNKGSALNPNAITELEADLESVTAQREIVSEKTKELGKKVQSIDSLLTDQRENLEKLSEVKARIDHLTVESAITGRLAVISQPEIPEKPAKDLRIPLAAAGAIGGVGLGFGIILLLGLLKQRFRHIEDVTEGLDKYRMLGVVPELPETLEDAEHSEISALCVHQIRALLQLETREEGGQVFSVTSPCPRDGKSTLTLALGLSFAAAGSRVLVVDCDLIGRGLSAQMHRMIRGNVSEVLNPNRQDERRALESGLDEFRRLDAIVGLLNRARRSHQMNGSDELANLLRLSEEKEQLGEATVQNLVFLADREAEGGGGSRLWQALEEKARTMREGSTTALVTQGSQSLGLIDVIDGTDLELAVANTGVPNLSFLPPGTALQPEPDGTPPAALARLSPRTVSKVVELARHHFDAVIVDTGPMPGSLEASVFATQVDSVVVTLAQGSSVTLAEKTLKHLRSIGAHVGGIVYNRAPPVEIIRSSYMRSSLASRKDQF